MQPSATERSSETMKQQNASVGRGQMIGMVGGTTCGLKVHPVNFFSFLLLFQTFCEEN